ncbi:hypothetical protein NL487_28285, partial [Klebsiella pneumoniae]|nr:hypothetical protein [Klebsiella pneumoniae]
MLSFSIWHWLIFLITTAPFWLLLMIPISEVIRKAGFSRWWTLIYPVPLINLIALFVFAFSRWPAL